MAHNESLAPAEVGGPISDAEDVRRTGAHARLSRKVKDKEKLAKRRHEIFEAALEVFSAKGFHSAKIEDIAELVGVAKGTMYEYISNKAELFLFVIEEGMFKSREALGEVIEGIDSPTDRLKVLVLTQLELVARYRPLVSLYYQMPQVLSPENMAQIRDDQDVYTQIFISVLDEGIKTGEFRVMDSTLTARMLLSMCLFWATAHEEMGDEALEPVAKHMFEIVTRGINST